MSLLERAFTAMPHVITDRLLFGPHWAAVPLQVAVQRLMGGIHPVEFQLDGQPFYCQSSEKYFFERENFERELWPIFRENLGRADVVYDFGAHIGFWALRLSRLVGRLYAFEPSPTNWPRLLKNVGGIANVTAINAAVSSCEGELPFTDSGSMSSVGSATGGLLVKALTLDEFARGHEPPPTFMLVDVEGYAAKALAGATQILKSHPKIVCEVHGDSEYKAVITTLRQMGYRISFIDRKWPYPFRILAI